MSKEKKNKTEGLKKQIKTKDEKAYKVWIAIEYKNSYLKIKAFCFNNTSEDKILRYKLEAKKSGKSGTTNSFQAGSVYISSQEKKCLSQLGLRVFPTDYCQIKLKVYKDEKLVAEDNEDHVDLSG